MLERTHTPDALDGHRHGGAIGTRGVRGPVPELAILAIPPAVHAPRSDQGTVSVAVTGETGHMREGAHASDALAGHRHGGAVGTRGVRGPVPELAICAIPP